MKYALCVIYRGFVIACRNNVGFFLCSAYRTGREQTAEILLGFKICRKLTVGKSVVKARLKAVLIYIRVVGGIKIEILSVNFCTDNHVTCILFVDAFNGKAIYTRKIQKQHKGIGKAVADGFLTSYKSVVYGYCIIAVAIHRLNVAYILTYVIVEILCFLLVCRKRRGKVIYKLLCLFIGELFLVCKYGTVSGQSKAIGTACRRGVFRKPEGAVMGVVML